MKINEIFRSIQGESSYVGLPCIFIRLTGCNLRCKYCDTTYAYNEGKETSVIKIVEEVTKLYREGDIIEITGGEPLLQKEELKNLIDELALISSTILIETNGSIVLPKNESSDNTWDYVTWIMDWKLGSSEESEKMESINLDRLNTTDELKFVIGNSRDYDEMIRVLKKYRPNCKILVSTVWDNENLRKEVVSRMLKDNLKARFQVQLHKIVWDKNKRGV